MSNENYLRNVLNDQNLTQNQIENLRNLRNRIEQQLKSGFKGSPRTYYGGSYKKKTMISIEVQVNYVKNSKRQDTIRLMKLWKKEKVFP